MSHGRALSSGLVTASGVVSPRRSTLRGVHIVTDGTNAATVILYDNASGASGNELFKGAVAGADLAKDFALPEVFCQNGIYASVTGTGAACIIYYD